ncbi:MAG: T9SS type A sorting domain-containing protein [Candidatus Marinimicrobia bacterium]|nr:T9SS type A sorting domain-containing protein [Candidatus Neomarinimicrobiota bacterium]
MHSKGLIILLIVFLATFSMSSGQEPIAFYPFNGNANDETGNGNDGLNYGATLIVDRFGIEGSAFTFDNPLSSDINRIHMTGASGFLSGLPFELLSISTWFKAGVQNDNCSYITRFASSDGTFYLGYESNGNASFNLRKIEGGTLNQVLYAPAEPDTWNHLVGTWDGVTQRIYLNGDLVDEAEFNWPLSTASTGNTIGANYNGLSSPCSFDGAIDEVRIYDRALTTHEIDSLYHLEGWDSGLIAYYPFNGDAIDESGNGHDAYMDGSLLSTDRFGNLNSAFSFDGVDDVGYISQHGDLTVESFSLSFWTYLNSNDGEIRFFDNVSQGGGFEIGMQESGGINGLYIQRSGVLAGSHVWELIDTDELLAEDRWHHIVCSYDISSSTLALFVNNNLLASTIFNIDSVWDATYDLTLGRGAETTLYFLNGSLDDIYFFDRALNTDEIDSLFYLDGWDPSLIAYYPLDGDASDESGNGHDGTGYDLVSIPDRFDHADGALGFNGNSSRIQIGLASEIIPENSRLTLSAWVRPNSYDNPSKVFIGCENADQGLAMYYYPYNGHQLNILTGSRMSVDANLTPIGQWNHIVSTYDESDSLRVYINGAIVATSYQASWSHAPGADLFIGADENGTPTGGGFFDGDIDDIFIFGRALNAFEIDSMYHAGGWDAQPTGNVSDVDGNVYETIVIGDQEWMVENLKVTHYRNGEPIPNLIENGEWTSTNSGAFCYYNNDTGNADTYGVLYNWFALTDPRGFAPEGWHIPTDEEWKALEMHLGMSHSDADMTGLRGSDEGGKLKETGFMHWISPNSGATNQSGFMALPGSNRNPNSGIFDHAGSTGYGTSIWTSSPYDNYRAYWRNLTYNSSQIGREYSYSNNKRSGFSVRCVKDTEESDKIAYYPFSGNADDASGNGNHGSVSGASLTVDRFGEDNSAYVFDGVDDVITTAYTPSIQEDDEYSISAWMKTASANSHFLGLERTGAQQIAGFVNDGPARFIFRDDGNSNPSVSSFTEVNDSLWHHVVFTRSSNDSLYCYIDGELENSAHDNTSAVNITSPLTMSLGAGNHETLGNVNHYQGMLDDVAFYNTALSEEEVQTLYREGSILIDIGNVVAVAGGSIIVPINVVFPDADLYRSAELNFSGYVNGLQFVGIETAGTMLEGLGWSIQHNENESMLLTAYAGTQDVSGSGVFCYLMFDVVGEICTTIPIHVEYAKFNSNEWVETMNGGVTIQPAPYYGDADHNGTVEALDASDVLLHVLDDSYLDCQGIANADVYLDEVVDAMDASIILMYIVEYFDELPVNPTTTFLASGNLDAEDQEAIPNSIVSIPFNISEGESIYAFEGSISYDPSKVTPSEDPIDWSHLLDGFIISTVVEEDMIHFVGAGANPDGAEGVFLTSNFILNEDVEIGEETIITLNGMKFNSNLVLEDVSAIIASVVSVDPIAIPDEFVLQQNYPNPFNPSTTIRYGLPVDANVSLMIYDIRGQVIQTIESGYQPAGWYNVNWSGKTVNGKAISTGIYFARLVADDNSEVIKMLYLK